jgi:leucine-rich repeat protein SHOC2
VDNSWKAKVSNEKQPAATCDSAMGCLYSKRAARDDLHANICDLPVELKALVLSHIEHIEAHHILALSWTFQEGFSLLRALPPTFDFEGVEGDLVDHLVRLLGDDRVRSLDKERALELIGVHRDRLCEYACVQRNFEVLKWARNELNLPWAPYPPGHVSDDVLVLRMLREAWPTLKEEWRVDVGPESWPGVTMVDGRVVKLQLTGMGLTGAVPAEVGHLSALRVLYLGFNQLTTLPAEIGQLTSLEELYLNDNLLTSLPAEIGQLTPLQRLHLNRNRLTSLPAEIGQLTSLEELDLNWNQLTSVPAEIGQLISLVKLYLLCNHLTSVPAEIGQLISLVKLDLRRNKLMSLPAEIGQLTSLTRLDLRRNKLMSLPAEIGQLTLLEVLFLNGNQLTSVPAEIGQLTSLVKLVLSENRLTSLPAEIGQLTPLTYLSLSENRLTSLPAEIGQLTSLTYLSLRENRLTSLPAEIGQLRAAGCNVNLDAALTNRNGSCMRDSTL